MFLVPLLWYRLKNLFSQFAGSHWAIHILDTLCQFFYLSTYSCIAEHIRLVVNSQRIENVIGTFLCSYVDIYWFVNKDICNYLCYLCPFSCTCT